MSTPSLTMTTWRRPSTGDVYAQPSSRQTLGVKSLPNRAPSGVTTGGASWAKRPGCRRRSPRGSPQSQAITRTTCMAVAVKRCWRCVRARPMYRLWRRSKRRIPCERLLFTPARRAYWGLKAAVSCRWRAAWIASWCACGRTVSWRGASLAEVHARRAGHARHVAPSNRMRITGSPETSCPGRQWILVWPWGQRACCASQSKTKACKS
jgi:hypothetical protein